MKPQIESDICLDFFPDDEALLKVFDERATLLAKTDVDEIDTNLRDTYIRFRLGENEYYGMPYKNAEEIREVQNICPVPCTPSCIFGVINLRGEILTVIDLKKFFGIEGGYNYEEARILIAKNDVLLLGMIVDEIIGSEEYELDKLEPALPSVNIANLDFIKGIYAGSVAMLDVDVLMADQSLVVNQSNR